MNSSSDLVREVARTSSSASVRNSVRTSKPLSYDNPKLKFCDVQEGNPSNGLAFKGFKFSFYLYIALVVLFLIWLGLRIFW